MLGPLKEVLDENHSMRVLASVELLSKLSEDERAMAVKLFSVKAFPTGSKIIEQGDWRIDRRIFELLDQHELFGRAGGAEGHTIDMFAAAGKVWKCIPPMCPIELMLKGCGERKAPGVGAT